jgi:hypothetical protein
VFQKLAAGHPKFGARSARLTLGIWAHRVAFGRPARSKKPLQKNRSKKTAAGRRAGLPNELHPNFELAESMAVPNLSSDPSKVEFCQPIGRHPKLRGPNTYNTYGNALGLGLGQLRQVETAAAGVSRSGRPASLGELAAAAAAGLATPCRPLAKLELTYRQIRRRGGGGKASGSRRRAASGDPTSGGDLACGLRPPHGAHAPAGARPSGGGTGAVNQGANWVSHSGHRTQAHSGSAAAVP